MLSGGQSKPVFKNEDMNPINPIKNNYNEGVCPDCIENIPDDVSSGDACRNCGHVFYAPVDDTNEKTEEVCDECGSTNIGYDALVKNIGGELEVVGGPYDSCQCINCQNLETNVRSVPVQNLRYCDGKDCYYQGDKNVMTNKPMTNDTDEGINQVTRKEFGRSYPGYWYCSRCAKEINVPEEDIVGKLDIIAEGLRYNEEK